MRTRLGVAGLVLLAVGLRAANLDGMSLWTDEGLSFYRATKDLAFILSGRIDVGLVPTTDVQPPLYFVLLAGWFDLLGATPWTGKAFSLLASVPAVPLLWALARRLAGRRAAWPAALFAAVAPVYLWYAQEVRHYTLLVTLAVASVYALTVALEIPGAQGMGLWPYGRRRACALAAALGLAALAMWVHYLAVFLIVLEVAALATAGLIRWRSRRGGNPAAALLAVAALVLLVVPLVPFALERLRLGAERDQHFVGLPVILRDVAVQFTLGVAPLTDSWWVVVLLSALAAVGWWRAWRRSRPAAVLLVACLIVPVLALFALTFVKPVYMGVRHILLASPAWYVLLGAAVALPRAWTPVWTRRAATTAAAAATLTIAGLMIAHSAPHALSRAGPLTRAGKDDLRSMARFIAARAAPGDVLLLSDPVLAHALQVYLPGMPISSVPMPGDPRPAAEQFAQLDATAPRIWFMTPGEEEAAWLDQHRAGVLRETFEGHTIPVRIEAWDRVPDPADLRASSAATPTSEPLALVGWAATPAEDGSAMRLHLALEAQGGPRFLTASVRVLDQEGREVARVEQPQREAAPDGARLAAIDVPIPAGVPSGDYDVLVSLYTSEEYAGYVPTGALESDSPDITWPANGPLFLGQVAVQSAPRPVTPEPDVPVQASGGGWRIVGARDAPRWIGNGAVDVSVWVTRDGPEGEARRLRISVVPDGVASSEAVASAEVDLPQDLVPGASRLLFVTVRPPHGGPADGSAAELEESEAVPARIAASLIDGGGATIPLEEPLAVRTRAALAGQDTGPGAVAPRLLSALKDDDPGLADLAPLKWYPMPPPVTAVPAGEALSNVVEVEGLGSLVGFDPALRRPPPRSPTSETPPVEVAASLENGIWQYVVNQAQGNATELPLRLYWRSDGVTTRNLAVSAQLLPPAGSADGRPVAQSDYSPSLESRPTSGWRAGEIVADTRSIQLPTGLPRGDYILAVTVYDPGHRGGRLRATVAGSGVPPGGGAIADDLIPIARVRIGGAEALDGQDAPPAGLVGGSGAPVGDSGAPAGASGTPAP